MPEKTGLTLFAVSGCGRSLGCGYRPLCGLISEFLYPAGYRNAAPAPATTEEANLFFFFLTLSEPQVFHEKPRLERTETIL